MADYLAFIDEYGDCSLSTEKPDCSTHFILTAVLIDPLMLGKIEEQLEVIRKKYFQKGEIKSRKVGNMDKRRIIILNSLSLINFKIFALVVNKKNLVSEGFKFKESFIKYLNKIIDKELYSAFPRLQITVDEHGTTRFMNSLKIYIESNHPADLFNRAEFGFAKSNSNLLVQLADFISGTLARCYDKKKKSEKANEFLNIIRNNIIDIKEWPTIWEKYIFEPSSKDGSHSDAISYVSLTTALNYTNQKHDYSIPINISKIACLKYLIFIYRNVDKYKYISTAELISHININNEKPISEHMFRTKIIGKLRDDGILIASSEKGYKLPATENDLFDFINHSNRTKLATNDKLDLLDKEEYKNLKRLIE
jgi:biotin operon repressor